MACGLIGQLRGWPDSKVAGDGMFWYIALVSYVWCRTDISQKSK